MTNSPDPRCGVTRKKLTGRNNPGHSNRLAVPFDIDQFIRSCTSGLLDIYFDAIHEADDASLERFRREVIRHKRQSPKKRYLAERTPQGIYRFSLHDEYLLKAIWWEKTKRSRLRLWLYKKTLPIRRAWLFAWRGMELRDNKWLGYHSVGRKEDYGILPYIGIRMATLHAAREARKYVARHHWQIIFALIGIATIYVTLLG